MTSTNLYSLFGNATQQNLESNQSGRLTDEQKSALKRGVRQQWWRIALWIIVLVVLCGAFGLLAFALYSSDSLGPSLLGPALGSAFVVAVAFLVLGAFLFPDLSLIRAGRDIEEGRVETVLGRSEWTGHRYQLISDLHTLRTVRGNVSMPPPGEYRFYCLPNSGLVIQAEALTRSGSSLQGNDLLLDALSQAHRFSKDDLSTNQQGSLSGGQALRLIGFAIGQGALLLLSVGFGAWMYFNVPMKGDDQIWMIVLGLFVVIFALVMVWNIFKTFLDLLSRSVAHEEGYVIRTEHRTRNGRYYTYQIKKLKFRVSRNTFRALVDSWEYRVHYSPRSKHLLAIEPIGSGPSVLPDVMER